MDSVRACVLAFSVALASPTAWSEPASGPAIILRRGNAILAHEDSRAAWNGSAWLVAWNRDGQLQAMRVSARGDALGETTRLASVAPDASFAVVSDRHGWLIAWVNAAREPGEIRGTILRPDGTVVHPEGVVLVPATASARGDLALGFGAGTFLLVWSESTPDRGVDLRAQRWSGALSPGDPRPFTIASTANDDVAPAVEGNSDAYYLVWRETTADARVDRLRGTLVSSDGIAADAEGDVLGDRPSRGTRPSVYWDGRRWFASWTWKRVPGTPVSATGTPGWTAPAETSIAGDAVIPASPGPRAADLRPEIGPSAESPPETVVKAGASADHRLATWLGEGPEIQSTDCSILEGVLFCSAETRTLNGVRHSSAFPSIRDALVDLPSADGRLNVDPGEDDPTPFVETNPASASDGRKDALVIDSRRGGIRFLSSAPEYPSGAAGKIEERVPFVFQTRRDDSDVDYDDAPGAIGEWNCAVDLPDVYDEWRNCPTGNASWGVAGGSKQYWHSGQCNTKPEPDSGIGTTAICGGPHILEVRYPEQPGVHESKPVFAVGNGGVSIYQPDRRNHYWRSWLTMFRGDPAANPGQSNTPMYVFDAGGAYFDGGTFLGNTEAFPFYTRHIYPAFNAWVQKDILPEGPAFVVEGGGNDLDAEQVGPLVRFLDRTCCTNWDHTFAPGTNHRESFGFYANSVLKLGSFTTNPALDRGQYIEWEGLVLDGNETRLRVEEPSAPRVFTLPDAPDAGGAGGKVQVASGADTHGTVMWGSGSDDFDSGDEVCAAAGLDCVAVKSSEGAVDGCDADQGSGTSYFFAFCK